MKLANDRNISMANKNSIESDIQKAIKKDSIKYQNVTHSIDQLTKQVSLMLGKYKEIKTWDKWTYVKQKILNKSISSNINSRFSDEIDRNVNINPTSRRLIISQSENQENNYVDAGNKEIKFIYLKYGSVIRLTEFSNEHEGFQISTNSTYDNQFEFMNTKENKNDLLNFTIIPSIVHFNMFLKLYKRDELNYETFRSEANDNLKYFEKTYGKNIKYEEPFQLYNNTSHSFLTYSKLQKYSQNIELKLEKYPSKNSQFSMKSAFITNDTSEQQIKTIDIVHISTFGLLKPLYICKDLCERQNIDNWNSFHSYYKPVLNSFDVKCRFKVDVVELNAKRNINHNKNSLNFKMGKLLLENKHISERSKFGITEMLTFDYKSKYLDSVKVNSTDLQLNSIFIFEVDETNHNNYIIKLLPKHSYLKVWILKNNKFEFDYQGKSDKIIKYKGEFTLKFLNSSALKLNLSENNMIFNMLISSGEYKNWKVEVNSCDTFSFIPLNHQEDEEIKYFIDLSSELFNVISEYYLYDIQIETTYTEYLKNAEDFLWNVKWPNLNYYIGDIISSRQTMFGLFGLLSKILEMLAIDCVNIDFQNNILKVIHKWIINHYENVSIILDRQYYKYANIIMQDS